MQKYQSPLRRAYGDDAPNLQQAFTILTAQLQDCLTLPIYRRENYQFRLDETLAHNAREEHYLKTSKDQNALREFTIRNWSPKIKDLTRIHYTKGRCPQTNELVAACIRPDTQNLKTLFQQMRESPDELLSELYAPVCAVCEPEDKSAPEVRHPTILSYTRYYPSWLLKSVETVDKAEQKLLEFRHQEINAYQRGLGREETRQLPQRRNERVSALNEANRELLKAIKEYQSGVLFVSTRLKGASGLEDKATRIMLQEALPAFIEEREMRQIHDSIALKDIVKSPRDVEREVTRISKSIVSRRGQILTAPQQVTRPGHECVKIRAQIDEGSIIEIQVQTYDQFFHDQSTHRQYEEERQQAMEEQAKVYGINTLSIRKEIARVFGSRQS
jgi:hypothetical protein